MLVDRICEACGCAYQSRPERNIRYCSRACYHIGDAHKPVEASCEVCGNKFIQPATHKKKTCSKVCADKLTALGRSKQALFTCQQCGKEFGDKAGRTRKFCSRECSDKGREIIPQAMVTLDCLHCGQPFQHPANRVTKSKHQQFCSKDCWYKHKRYNARPLVCKNCGNEFHVKPSQRARSYCCRDCYIEYKTTHYPYPKGNANLYGLNWFEQRDSRRAIDKFRCQGCGTHEENLDSQLHVHHVIAFRNFGIERYEEANQLSNLVSLCSTCHKRLEHLPDVCTFLAIRSIM